MKSFVVCLLTFVVVGFVSASVGRLTVDGTSEEFFQEQYGFWLDQFDVTYSSSSEYIQRYAIFKANMQRVKALNEASTGAKFGMTRFMDLTQEEFKQRYLMNNLTPVRYEQNRTAPAMPQAPSSFDWRSKSGVLTPVYNQGQCGSCWAFSATENIESQWALAGNSLTELSMQQIVDCDTTDYGCNGGWPYDAYAYIINAGGQDPLSDYPYTAQNGQCKFSSSEVVAKLSSWNYVTQNQDEQQMVNYLYSKGPLSVCVDAESWQFYTSGVMSASQCGTSIDHCVLAVGYDTSASTPYWSIRNSWGASWGESGFIRLQYGADTCAVAQVVTSAIVA